MMLLSRLDNVSRPALLLVVSRAIGSASSFAVPMVLARTLDLSDFGTYKQVFLIFATLFGLAQLGMAESLYYFVPRNAAGAGRHVCNSLIVLALAGLGCLAVLFATRESIAAWMSNPELAEYLVPLGFFVTFMLMSAVFEIVLVSRRRHVAAAWTYGVSDVVRTVALVAPALLLGSVYGVMIGAVVFAGLRVIAMLVALWREFGRDFRVDLSLWRLQLAYALPFALAVGVEVLQIYFHQYFVASRFDAATFAIYAVGCLQIPLLDLITSSIGNVMMVKMGEDEGKGDRRAALTLWHDSVIRQALLLFPLMVILIVAAHEIIVVLYTSAFLASVPIFMLWSLTIFPAVFAVDPVLRVYAQTRFLLYMNIVRVVLVAALIGWCLSAFGLYGAVLITLLSSCAVKGMGLVRIARLMHVRVVDVLPWRSLALIALGALVAGWPAYWMLRHIAMPAVVGMFAASALYGTTYIALCVAYVRLGEPQMGRLKPAPTGV